MRLAEQTSLPHWGVIPLEGNDFLCGRQQLRTGHCTYPKLAHSPYTVLIRVHSRQQVAALPAFGWFSPDSRQLKGLLATRLVVPLSRACQWWLMAFELVWNDIEDLDESIVGNLEAPLAVTLASPYPLRNPIGMSRTSKFSL